MKINLSKIGFCLFMLSILQFESFAQSSTWYFGNNAGLRFNGSNLPTSVTGSSMVTNEGSSAVTDPNGNVLFYTDGRRLWHGNHTEITTANQNLGGSSSSTHSALIVPIPTLECTRFILFTLGAVEDIDPDNVCSSDNALTPTGIGINLVSVQGVFPNHTITISSDSPQRLLNDIHFTEKQAMTRDLSGNYQVMHHDYSRHPNNPAFRFYKHRITPAFAACTSATQVIGLLNQATHRQIISTWTGFHTRGTCHAAQGQMKFSPDGTYFAMTAPQSRDASGTITNRVYFFTFILSGTGTLSFLGSKNFPDPSHVYGLEFSPNSRFCYVSGGLLGSSNFGKIYQVGLNTNSTTFGANPFIECASYTRPSCNSPYGFNALQLGTDGRIYVAGPGAAGCNDVNVNTAALSIINSPNTQAVTNQPGGGVGFNLNSILITPSTRGLGLPTIYSTTATCLPPPEIYCACEGVTATTTNATVQLNTLGNMTIPLTLNSGGRIIRRVKISLNGWEQIISDPCKDFSTISTISMGNFVFPATVPAGWATFMGLKENAAGSIYAPEITLDRPDGVVLANAAASFNLRFPPALQQAGCLNRIRLCLRVEMFDERCIVCESIVCIDKQASFVPPGQNRSSVDNQPIGNDLKGENLAKAVVIYPNPGKENLKVLLAEAVGGSAYEIYDLQGKSLSKGVLEDNNQEIDTKFLKPGNYLIKISNASYSHTEHYIKE